MTDETPISKELAYQEAKRIVHDAIARLAWLEGGYKGPMPVPIEPQIVRQAEESVRWYDLSQGERDAELEAIRVKGWGRL